MKRRAAVLATAAVVTVVVIAAGAWLLRRDPVAVATVTLAHDRSVAAVAFSPDGRTLAAVEASGVVRLWDYRARRATAGPGSGVGPSMAFSPDGARLAIGGYDSRVEVRDVATGQATTLAARAGMATALAFGPTLVAAGGTDGIRLRTASSGTDGPVLDGGERPVGALAFSPDGALLAAGGRDGVRLWNPATGALVTTLGGHGGVSSLAFAPDGGLLAAGGDDARVRIWNLTTFRLVHTLTGHRRSIASVAFGPDGLALASVDGSSGDPKEDNDVTIRLWRVRSGTPIGTIPVDGRDGNGSRCSPSYTIDTTVAVSRDGATLAANCGAGVRLWRLTGR